MKELKAQFGDLARGNCWIAGCGFWIADCGLSDDDERLDGATVKGRLLSLRFTLRAAFGWLFAFGYFRCASVPFGRFAERRRVLW
jgi:hypothetical protein